MYSVFLENVSEKFVLNGLNIGHLRVNRLFFLKANTNELHPKVRKTCIYHLLTYGLQQNKMT